MASQVMQKYANCATALRENNKSIKHWNIGASAFHCVTASDTASRTRKLCVMVLGCTAIAVTDATTLGCNKQPVDCSQDLHQNSGLPIIFMPTNLIYLISILLCSVIVAAVLLSLAVVVFGH